jgi:hypothetical protein
LLALVLGYNAAPVTFAFHLEQKGLTGIAFVIKKLFTKEDPQFIHKFFGLLVLVSFFYRFVCFALCWKSLCTLLEIALHSTGKSVAFLRSIVVRAASATKLSRSLCVVVRCVGL